MKNDSYWMEMALAEAIRSNQIDEVPVGAVLVKDGKKIASGYNQPIKGNNPCAHAEIVAIQSACLLLGNYRLPGTSLFVTLEPCMMCVGAMIHARIEHVVFGASDERSGIFRQIQPHVYSYFNHSLKVTGGVLAEESSDLLKSFFKKKRLIS